MDIWTTAEEAAKLAERFKGVKNRKQFADEHGIPGGDTMVYQHLKAVRPMSQEAAVAYARAFQCGLEDISPRIAQEVALMATMIGNKNAILPPTLPSQDFGPKKWEKLNKYQQELVESFIDWVLARQPMPSEKSPSEKKRFGKAT